MPAAARALLPCCLAIASATVGAAACSRDLALPSAAAQTVDGRAVAEEPGTGRTLPAAGARVEFAGTGLAVVADEQGLFSFARPAPTMFTSPGRR